MSDHGTILLIEDSPSQALSFRLILEQAGYSVTVIDDGAAGWRYAWDNLPRLILLDIGLPSLDGFQILSRLKRGTRTAQIPVVMLTQRDNIASVERALSLGADDYIFKDDAAVALCDSVAQILQV